MVYNLVKSLYELKQAFKQWNFKLTEALVNLSFKQSHLGYSLFTTKQGKSMVTILVYVDDLLITRNDTHLIQETKKVLYKSLDKVFLGN